MRNIVIYGLSESLGGIETIILALVRRLINCYKFTIVLSDKDNCGYLDRIPSEVSVVNLTSWGRNPHKFQEEFRLLLNEINCDFVWVNACVTSNRNLIKAIKSSNVPTRLITHSHGTNYENDGFFKSIIVKTLHRFNRNLYNKTASLKWACSIKAAEWFYGKNEVGNVTIINNGIDTNKFKYNEAVRNQMRKSFNCVDSLVCLHIGRLTQVKNQSYVLNVFSEICKYNPNSLLFIAGIGELESQLKIEAVSLGIENKVKFLGQYSSVHELYNMSDVFLLPSIHEGMPLTLVEAQCAGLHCYVSSTISKEVCLSSFLSFLPISESPSVWAKQILSRKCEPQRDLGRIEIIQAGFDIEGISNQVLSMINSVQ